MQNGTNGLWQRHPRHVNTQNRDLTTLMLPLTCITILPAELYCLLTIPQSLQVRSPNPLGTYPSSRSPSLFRHSARQRQDRTIRMDRAVFCYI